MRKRREVGILDFETLLTRKGNKKGKKLKGRSVGGEESNLKKAMSFLKNGNIQKNRMGTKVKLVFF